MEGWVAGNFTEDNVNTTNHLTEPQGRLEIDFDAVARLPAPNDNVAIATQTLEGGTRIRHGGQQFQLSHTILEGHRFAIQPISADAPLLSWGLPFGFATRSIEPGDYVCNQKMIDSLSIRNLSFTLPETPNFNDKMAPYQLDDAEILSRKTGAAAHKRAFLPRLSASRKSWGWHAKLYRRHGDDGTDLWFCEKTCGDVFCRRGL